MLLSAIALLFSSFNAEPVAENTLSERGKSSWGDRILAPYLYTSKWNTFDVDNAFKKTGHNTWTLCFMLADKWGKPAWNGDEPIDQQFFSDYIKKIRNTGGDVIVSFGGASGNEFAIVTKDVDELAKKYQAVIDKYDLTYIDIDIEGSSVANKGSVDRRSKALKIVKDNNKNLILSYTLATTPDGLPDDVLYIVKSAKNAGLKLDVVNIMTMDYGGLPNGATGMGGYTISSAEGLRKQLIDVGMKSTKVGITPMIGQNDVKDEIFRVADAKKLADWADGKDWVRTLAFWSINRDNSKNGDLFVSTKIKQKDFEFLKTLKKWSN